HNALARLDFDPASVNNANETVTISTYTNNEPSGAKQASEAFNYVAQDRKSVTSAVLAAEGSFVQLMCSMPPVR
ncbi:hypothetical protein GGF48_002971, partial [Coemansia sp. RSA 921]